MRSAGALIALLLVVVLDARVEAQLCSPVGIFSIVRGEDGRVLNEAELEFVLEESPAPLGDGVAAATHAVYENEAESAYLISREGDPRIPIFYFRGTRPDCFLHLTEVTLVYRQREMRLVFAVTLEAGTEVRTPEGAYLTRPLLMVVDSLPFREGAFELDFDSWLSAARANRDLNGIPRRQARQSLTILFE
jgi:hypothetical protein